MRKILILALGVGLVGCSTNDQMAGRCVRTSDCSATLAKTGYGPIQQQAVQGEPPRPWPQQ